MMLSDNDRGRWSVAIADPAYSTSETQWILSRFRVTAWFVALRQVGTTIGMWLTRKWPDD